jgi:hypothetical protein
VPTGTVRCGKCGWLIEKQHEWREGGNGPEHVIAKTRPTPLPFKPRTWTRR